ncbi:MAG: hypothetical protein KKC21_05445 [Nitrospinae bacterium]|nr:hypothetical protein [Nitrospinota bacterium]
MKRDDILVIKCPCCNTNIRVDLETSKIIHVSQAKTKLSMEEMVKGVKDGKAKVMNRFEEEKEKLKGRKDALDKLFKESVKRVTEGESSA